MADKLVKYFHMQMQGAPQLGNNWGDMTTMLDACLITGFNQKTVVSAAFDGADMVLTLGTGHGFEKYQVLQISGANDVAYNGEFRVNKVEAEKVYLTASNLPEITTGTITAKVAPLDFELAFKGDMKRAYRSKNPKSRRHFLRVDDSCPGGYNTSWRKFARVNIAEDMIDVDTFAPGAKVCPIEPSSWTGTTPKGSGDNMIPGWCRWEYCVYNSGSERYYYTANSKAYQWILVGDDRGFYLNVIFDPNYSSYVCGFNEFNSLSSNDLWNTVLIGKYSRNTVNNGDSVYSFGNFSNDSGIAALCTHFGHGLHETVYPQTVRFCKGNRYLDVWGSGASTYSDGDRALLPPSPNSVDFGFIATDVWLQDSRSSVRGILPGCYFTPHYLPIKQNTVINNTDGRRLVSTFQRYDVVNYPGCMFFDLSDKWNRHDF